MTILIEYGQSFMKCSASHTPVVLFKESSHYNNAFVMVKHCLDELCFQVTVLLHRVLAILSAIGLKEKTFFRKGFIIQGSKQEDTVVAPLSKNGENIEVYPNM